MFFLFVVGAFPGRDIDSIENELTGRLDHIDRQLAALHDLRCRLAMLNPSGQGTNSLSQNLTQKNLNLVGVNTARTKQLRNAKLWTKQTEPLLAEYPLTFVADDIAPIFTFQVKTVSAAKKAVFDAIIPAACAIRQLRFRFYFQNEHPFISRVFDLPNGLAVSLEIDFDVEIVFTELEIDVLANWGDDHKTCLNPFHILGPMAE
jgi:hypothetical protein